MEGEKGPRCPGCGRLVDDGEPGRCPGCGLDFEYYADLREVAERLGPALAGSPVARDDDLSHLDALHLAAWEMARGPQLTRVLSAGRTHVWPGDPDDVVAWLLHNGYGFRLLTRPGPQGETLVLVVSGPKGAIAP